MNRDSVKPIISHIQTFLLGSQLTYLIMGGDGIRGLIFPVIIISLIFVPSLFKEND